MVGEDTEEFQKLGLIASIVGHLVILILVFAKFGSGWGDFQQPVVYSVTIEGGKKLGGMAQVPEKDQKTAVAPPKKVSSQEKPSEEKKPEVKEPEKPKESKIPEADKGEVQIKKKEVKEDKKTPKKEDKKSAKDQPNNNKSYENLMQRYLGESSNAGGTGFGAAALGGTGMGGGVVRPPEFFAYQKKLEEFIKSGWVWTDAASPLVAQIVFEMTPDGKLSGIVITKGSGNREYDDSVMRAVMKANPVPPPPTSVYEFFRSVRMTFDPRE